THSDPITVTDSAITGYAWSETLGWINFAPTNGGVTNTKNGVLGGYAWGSAASWVNFSPTNGGVTIDKSSGAFSGWAWISGPGGGWVKFDCDDTDACVKTTWRPASGGHISGGGGGGSGGTTTPVTPPQPANQPAEPTTPPPSPQTSPETNPTIPETSSE